LRGKIRGFKRIGPLFRESPCGKKGALKKGEESKKGGPKK